MAPFSTAPRLQLNFCGAAIEGDSEVRDPTIWLPNQSEDVSYFALDIGGSLAKLVYFSRDDDRPTDEKKKWILKEKIGGRLHFVKFLTTNINECLDFIYSKQLYGGGIDPQGRSSVTVVKATGGGAYKVADMFKERLGISIEKEDEMVCLAAGANFLLKAIPHEAFTHIEGQKKFVQIDQNDLFPYLLVNIGSGISMLKVDGDGKCERVNGTMVGGGTFWGLGRLLTKCQSYDELLELSQKGDNKNVDMLVGDIYGGKDYNKIGLSATAIASSFGKTISENKKLEDFRPEDIALSLLRLFSYNTAQIAHLVAREYGIRRIFFGGLYIRGHAYTMNTISLAVNFWSKGEVKAMFLRHEGFLTALGALTSAEKDTLLYPRNGFVVPSSMENCVREATGTIAPIPNASPRSTDLGSFKQLSSKGKAGQSNEVATLLADPKIDDDDNDDDYDALLDELEAKIARIKKERAEKKLQKQRRKQENVPTVGDAGFIGGN